MKVLNVFGIILAWILSIALVAVLIGAPLTLSALSVLEPNNIVNVVTKGFKDSQEAAAAKLDQAYAFEKLSVSLNQDALTKEILGALDLKEIEDIVGKEIDAEVVTKVMTSDAATEIFEVYASDVANALTGEPGESQLTAEKLEEIVRDNQDKIVEAIEEAGVSLTESQKQKLKDEIIAAVQKNADKVIDLFPAPEKIAESLVEDSEMGEVFAVFLEGQEKIKTVIVGTIVLLSLLILLLRIPGFRGLRWLATDLFAAGGINVILCLVLGLSSTAIKGLAAGFDSAVLEGIADGFLSQLTKGVLIRTAIMLVAAAALLVAYYLLKNLLRNKKTNKPVLTYNEVIYNSEDAEYDLETEEEFLWEDAEPVGPADDENE